MQDQFYKCFLCHHCLTTQTIDPSSNLSLSEKAKSLSFGANILLVVLMCWQRRWENDIHNDRQLLFECSVNSVTQNVCRPLGKHHYKTRRPYLGIALIAFAPTSPHWNGHSGALFASILSATIDATGHPGKRLDPSSPPSLRAMPTCLLLQFKWGFPKTRIDLMPSIQPM